MGKAMRAVSHDFDAAGLMGIPTDNVIAFTFSIGAALAAAGGVLFGGLTFKSLLPLMGVQMGLKAFVAAVVGGIGSIPQSSMEYCTILGLVDRLPSKHAFYGLRQSRFLG